MYGPEFEIGRVIGWIIGAGLFAYGAFWFYKKYIRGDDSSAIRDNREK